MPPPATIATLSWLLVAALALGACGGSDREQKNAYVREVNAAQERFAQTVTSVSEKITPKSSATQDRRTLERFRKAIADVVERLRGVDAPEDVKAEHARLVEAMSGFGADIERATDALRDPDSRKIAEAQRAIAAATQTVNLRIDEAIAAINQKLGAT